MRSSIEERPASGNTDEIFLREQHAVEIGDLVAKTSICYPTVPENLEPKEAKSKRAINVLTETFLR